MWDWLQALDLGRWWKVAIAAGLVIAIPAIATKDHHVLLVGLAMIACGFGEWMNHAKEIEIRREGVITSFERKYRALGVILDVLGLILLAIGLVAIISQ